MKLTRTTTRECLEKCTKAELAAALLPMSAAEAHRAATMLTKAVLVDNAVAAVTILARDHAEAEAKKKAEHDAALTAESADPKVAAIKNDLLAYFSGLADKREESILKFREKITKGPVCYVISYYAEDAMKADCELAEFMPWANLMRREIEEPKFTLAEILEHTKGTVREKTRRALDDGYRHNSTGYIANLENMCKHGAVALAAKTLAAVAEELEKAVADTAAYTEGTLSRVFVW